MSGGTLKCGPPPVGAGNRATQEMRVSEPRFRQKPPEKRATEASERAPPESKRPPPRALWRYPGIPISGSPRQYCRKPQIFASARNRATCGRGDSQMRAFAGWRSWSVAGPHLRRTPPLNRRRRRQKTRRRDPVGPPQTTSGRDPEIPISGFPRQGRRPEIGLSNAGPRLQAQLVNFRTPFSPDAPL